MAKERREVLISQQMVLSIQQVVRAVKCSRDGRPDIGCTRGRKGCVALALAGGTSLWLAILADVGVSLLVTLNGMRPLLLK